MIDLEGFSTPAAATSSLDARRQNGRRDAHRQHGPGSTPLAHVSTLSATVPGGGRQREMLSSFITPLGLYESEHKHVYIYARARTHTHSHTCRRAESETDVNNPETDVAADSSEAAMRLSPLSSSARGPAIFSDEKQTPAQPSEGPSRPAVVSDKSHTESGSVNLAVNCRKIDLNVVKNYCIF